MMMQSNLDYILKNIHHLSEDDLSELYLHVKNRMVNAGEYYIEAGEFNEKLVYIKNGLIRVFHLFENGKETTVMFRWENSFLGNYDGIIFNRPSRFFYQALEATELLEIEYTVLDEYIHKNLNLSKVQNSVLLNMVGELLTRNEDFVLLNPEERYKKILEENSAIINRVQDKHLASLLGVTPVSLSRIKNRIFK